MNLKHIDIKSVYLKDLYSFAQGFAKAERCGRIVPITTTRALAQMKNPYAKENDIVLFVAYHEEECIGYIGQLPGLLNAKKQSHRVFWGSTFYVADQYRGRGIGRLLLDQVVFLHQDFVVTRITSQAHNSLMGYGMKVLGYLDYFQLRVEKVHLLNKFFTVLSKNKESSDLKRRSGKGLKRFENHFYQLEKRIFYRIASGFADKMAGNYQMSQVHEINESDFFKKPGHQWPFFYRGPEIINWMLQHKWLLSKRQNTKRIQKYHFSAFRQFFSYIALKIYTENLREYLGFIVICISTSKGKTVLRILDHSLKDDDVIPMASAAALVCAAKYQADRVEFSKKMGDYLMTQIFFKKFLKKQQREYIYFPKRNNSTLEKVKGKIKFDYCDGDTPFT
ncbi:MAG: GNAT family N-acetyltransferase [Desulfobacterales bacterium]